MQRLHWSILLPHSDASNYHAVSEISICDISQAACSNYWYVNQSMLSWIRDSQMVVCLLHTLSALVWVSVLYIQHNNWATLNIFVWAAYRDIIYVILQWKLHLGAVELCICNQSIPGFFSPPPTSIASTGNLFWGVSMYGCLTGHYLRDRDHHHFLVALLVGYLQCFG